MSKNYLNEKSTKSFLNYSIETNQMLFEMFKRVSNGEDLDYESQLNSEEQSKPKILSNAMSDESCRFLSEQGMIRKDILNKLKENGIKYEMVSDDALYTTNGQLLKFTCIIYNNSDTFIQIIKNKMGQNKNYELYLREHFIEKDDKDLVLYYCLLKSAEYVEY